jgi:hypothetical protein
MTNEKPRTPLKPNPGLRHGHLDPIKCTCGSEDGCKVPHDVWLIQGGRGPR